MKLKYVGLMVAIASLGWSGCAASPKKGSMEAGQKMLEDDQKAIDKADTRYREIILKHGESSMEAVKAKTELDNKKNQLAANQTHVQQLQRVTGETSDATSAPAGTTKETTTTTTITTTPN